MKLFFGILFCVFLSTQATAFNFDSTMPADQVSSIQYDQNYLAKLQFVNDAEDQATAQLMGVDSLTAANLQEWIDERVSTVISENLNLQTVLVAAPGAVYPDNQIPDKETPTAKVAEKPADIDPNSPKPQIVQVMANLGAALYEYGKEKSILLGIRYNDLTNQTLTLPFFSPHHGLIQVGLGLFMKDMRLNTENQDTPANAIFRLAVFFHESRHSDGQAKSLGFMHSICPPEHPYAGAAACDKSLNGAYTVQAHILKSMIRACGECSVLDKVMLQSAEADAASRVMTNFTNADGTVGTASEWDATFEKILGMNQQAGARK